MELNKYLLIITLNVNELNAPVKRHRVLEWIRKYDLPHNKKFIQGESERMEKILHSKETKKLG